MDLTTAIEWDRAVRHFHQYLPSEIESWLVLVERGLHARIVRSMEQQFHVQPLVLGEIPPQRLTTVAVGSRDRSDIGLLNFALVGADVRYGGRYLDALREFATWPPRRLRLCLDVWDENFSHLFSEIPADVERRCLGLMAKLGTGRHFEYFDDDEKSHLLVDCRGEWTVYSGAEPYDYVLPSGEVACLPVSVDGLIDVDGWIVGTLPFGPKYGRILSGDLQLTFRGSQISKVAGNRLDLCADVEWILNEIMGLRVVGEVGLGQSLAVRDAADIHPRGCLWHEKHLGLHLGLGAELAEMSSVRERETGYHVDIVLAGGCLRDGAGTLVMAW